MPPGWDASERIRDLLKERKDAGLPWTQDWLAAETGITRTTINAYCAPVTRGKKHHRDLGMTNAPRIAEALGVTVQDLGGPPETGESPLDEIRAKWAEIERRLAALEERDSPRQSEDGPTAQRGLP